MATPTCILHKNHRDTLISLKDGWMWTLQCRGDNRRHGVVTEGHQRGSAGSVVVWDHWSFQGWRAGHPHKPGPSPR